MNEDARFDASVLRALEGKVGPGVLGQIIDLFCEDCPRRMNAFREGRLREDLVAAAEALHAIKSSAAMLGARRLAELSQRMEQLARDGESAVLAEMATDLETGYSDAIAFLRQERRRLA